MGSQLTSLVFQPPEVTYVHGKNQLIWLITKRNVQIPAFYIDQGSKITLLFSHGNAEDLGTIYDWFVIMSQRLNVNIFAYDYEGYGKARGIPSERACYDDIEAAYSFLTYSMRIPSEYIVLYGRSLGSGPSLYLAEKLAKEGVRLGGVILQVIIFTITIPLPFSPSSYHLYYL